MIEADNDPPQEMGDSSVEVNDEMLELASAKRAEAMEAASDGDIAFTTRTRFNLSQHTLQISQLICCGVFELQAGLKKRSSCTQKPSRTILIQR